MDKKILVTGAGGNLGKQIVRTFLDAGYTVFGLLHGDQPWKQVVEKHWQAATDLTDAKRSQQTLQELLQHAGQLDVIMCTTGGFKAGDWLHTTAADIHQQIDLNFITALHTIQPLWSSMMQKGNGQIFLVGSRAGENILKGSGSMAYALSKNILFRFADLLNKEGHSHQIFTRVLIPGTIDTPENRAAMPQQDFTTWTPPEQIAEKVLSLSSQNRNDHHPMYIEV